MRPAPNFLEPHFLAAFSIRAVTCRCPVEIISLTPRFNAVKIRTRAADTDPPSFRRVKTITQDECLNASLGFFWAGEGANALTSNPKPNRLRHRSMNTTTKNFTAVATFFLLALAANVQAQTPPPAPVKTDHGFVQGTSENGLTVYRGIPFAAPPVGDLRWRAPQPAAKWDGVRPANPVRPHRPCKAKRPDERRLPVSERLDAREIRDATTFP